MIKPGIWKNKIYWSRLFLAVWPFVCPGASFVSPSFPIIPFCLAVSSLLPCYIWIPLSRPPLPLFSFWFNSIIFSSLWSRRGDCHRGSRHEGQLFDRKCVDVNSTSIFWSTFKDYWLICQTKMVSMLFCTKIFSLYTRQKNTIFCKIQ